MNKELRAFAEGKLEKNLAQCTEGQQRLFKKMYSFTNHKTYAGFDLDRPIKEVIQNLPDEKIDWAMQQVQRTVDKAQLLN